MKTRGKHKHIMKTLLRIAAVLAFLFPFVSGAGFLATALTSNHSDGLAIGAIGSFLVGNAIFIGAVLLVAAEKFNRNEGAQP